MHLVRRNEGVRSNILILAAGGGHTGYAYALAEELYGRTSLSFLVPTGDTLSARRLGKFGKVGFLLKAREPKTPNHVFFARLIKAFLESFRIDFRQFDAVVSAGSNFCVPPAMIAWILRVPVVSIESPVRFVKPSQSARFLQHFAAITALHWEEQKRLLRGVVVGPILPKPEVQPSDKGYILVSGGTFGHRLLFDILAQTSLRNVVLQTGRLDPLPYLEMHPEWTVLSVTERFSELIADSGMVVTHLGVTVLEAMVYKKPVVLVPNPEWTRTGSVKDAEQLAEKIGAVLVTKIAKQSLLEAIQKARESVVPDFPDGARNLANLILESF